MASKRDPEGVTWLECHFSYQLLQSNGCLRAFITAVEAETLFPDSIDQPDEWKERDADNIAGILTRVREQLQEENERLPAYHFLWWVDKDGKRWNGSTRITIPFGGIELVYPHNPIVKLDGGHGDVHHRSELKRYCVRVDPLKLDQYNAQVQRQAAELGLKNGEGYLCHGSFGSADTHPLIEEFEGWIQVEPVLNVLGEQIEVHTEDTLQMFEPDLNRAIDFCNRTRSAGLPLFWIKG